MSYVNPHVFSPPGGNGTTRGSSGSFLNIMRTLHLLVTPFHGSSFLAVTALSPLLMVTQIAHGYKEDGE